MNVNENERTETSRLFHELRNTLNVMVTSGQCLRPDEDEDSFQFFESLSSAGREAHQLLERLEREIQSATDH